MAGYCGCCCVERPCCADSSSAPRRRLKSKNRGRSLEHLSGSKAAGSVLETTPPATRGQHPLLQSVTCQESLRRRTCRDPSCRAHGWTGPSSLRCAGRAMVAAAAPQALAMHSSCCVTGWGSYCRGIPPSLPQKIPNNIKPRPTCTLVVCWPYQKLQRSSFTQARKSLRHERKYYQSEVHRQKAWLRVYRDEDKTTSVIHR